MISINVDVFDRTGPQIPKNALSRRVALDDASAYREAVVAAAVNGTGDSSLTSSPVSTAYSRTSPSKPPTATCFPSGRKATAKVGPSIPFNSWTSVFSALRASISLRVASSRPVLLISSLSYSPVL